MLRKKYTHLFFDLDHTLWDTDTNAKKSLEEMFGLFNLQNHGIKNREEFIEKYLAINNRLWTDYSLGRIKKGYLRNGRFELTLKQFGISDITLVNTLSDFFVDRTPFRKQLIPFAEKVLKHLKPNYKLYIITNGFKEAQHRKLMSAGIDHFFDDVFISEEIGCHKPNPDIFYIAMDKSNAKVENCLMIGDNIETDIAGAVAAGMDCIYLNIHDVKHNHDVVHETNSLHTLLEIL
jgi:putative hydrolase of the HAD superfamily